MFKELLCSPELKKKVRFNIIFPPTILLLVVLPANYLINGDDWNDFILGLWIILAILLLELFAGFTAYSRMPHKIIEINQNEFRYISVIGKEKTIMWSQIVKMGPTSDSPNDRYIIYNGNIFKGFTIDIREDWGKKLEQAWKEWKEKQNTSGELWREK